MSQRLGETKDLTGGHQKGQIDQSRVLTDTKLRPEVKVESLNWRETERQSKVLYSGWEQGVPMITRKGT